MPYSTSNPLICAACSSLSSPRWLGCSTRSSPPHLAGRVGTPHCEFGDDWDYETLVEKILVPD